MNQTEFESVIYTMMYSMSNEYFSRKMIREMIGKFGKYDGYEAFKKNWNQMIARINRKEIDTFNLIVRNGIEYLQMNIYGDLKWNKSILLLTP